jgi:hypothetical protein
LAASKRFLITSDIGVEELKCLFEDIIVGTWNRTVALAIALWANEQDPNRRSMASFGSLYVMLFF